MCQTQPFGLLCDESTDRGRDKYLVILVRLFDEQLNMPTTHFLDMPVCNTGTAQNVFDAIQTVFW
jgi:hypothetical protein